MLALCSKSNEKVHLKQQSVRTERFARYYSCGSEDSAVEGTFEKLYQ